MSHAGSSGVEVNMGISKAQSTYDHLWHRSDISLKWKGRVCCAAVHSVLLNGCETWNLSPPGVRRIEVSDRRCFRRGGQVSEPEIPDLSVNGSRWQLAIVWLVTTFDLVQLYVVLCHSKFQDQGCRPSASSRFYWLWNVPSTKLSLPALHKNVSLGVSEVDA